MNTASQTGSADSRVLTEDELILVVGGVQKVREAALALAAGGGDGDSVVVSKPPTLLD